MESIATFDDYLLKLSSLREQLLSQHDTEVARLAQEMNDLDHGPNLRACSHIIIRLAGICTPLCIHIFVVYVYTYSRLNAVLLRGLFEFFSSLQAFPSTGQPGL